VVVEPRRTNEVLKSVQAKFPLPEHLLHVRRVGKGAFVPEGISLFCVCVYIIVNRKDCCSCLSIW